MTFELPHKLTDIPKPFLIVCEGYGDVRLIDELLVQQKIQQACVGCPSRDFAPNIAQYMKALKALIDIQAKTVQGILIVVDADTSRDASFNSACEALRGASFPAPARPFSIEELNPRVAVYVMPGENRDGTLEHLLLDAAYRKNPKVEACIDAMFHCIGTPQTTANQQAKMRLSTLVGATCKGNAWASPAMIWYESENPVPIDSPEFDHLSDFLRRFSA
jgi:hypothetical protein